MASLLYIVLFAVLMASPPFSDCYADSSRKELRDKEMKDEPLIQLGRGSIQFQIHNRISLLQVVQLSWRPRVFLYEGFLTDEECDHLISLAQGAKKSIEGIVEDLQLAGSESRSNIDDNLHLLSEIEERISAWTFIPKENSKPLQVMHYGIEEVNQHFDYFGNRTLIANVPLMATLVLYLSNVTRGGEILFPESQLKGKVWSDCTKTSNVVKPVKGNAVLFFNTHLNATPDKSSTHSQCPVLEGEMWYATKHFLVRAVEISLPESDDSDCTDEDNQCPQWAAHGECQRNPIFMTGSPDYYGTCRKSCNAC